MKIHRGTFQSTAADFTVDMRTISADADAGDVQFLADFDIEVIGNDAAVTITVKGSFSSSVFLAVDEGTFAISGGKRSISGFCLSEIKFSRTGTTPYTINITRQIANS